jgi:hypothetical protein
VLVHPQLLLCVQSLPSFWRGPDIHLLNPDCLTLHFMISSMRVFLKILPVVLSLPRRSCSSKSRPIIPLMLSGHPTSLPEHSSFMGSWH